MHDLGAQTFRALGINDAGWVMGDGATNGPFLYHDGTAKELQTLLPPGSDWYLQAADAINKGQIAGTGISPSGGEHAHLLTPDEPPSAPEPSGIVLLTLGAVTLAGRYTGGGPTASPATTGASDDASVLASFL